MERRNVRDKLMLNLSGNIERVKQMNPMHGIPLSGTINRRREICFCLSGAVQRNNNSASSCTIKNQNLLTGAEDGSPSLPLLIDLIRSARTFNPVRRSHCGRQVIYGKGFALFASRIENYGKRDELLTVRPSIGKGLGCRDKIIFGNIVLKSSAGRRVDARSRIIMPSLMSHDIGPTWSHGERSSVTANQYANNNVPLARTHIPNDFLQQINLIRSELKAFRSTPHTEAWKYFSGMNGITWRRKR